MRDSFAKYRAGYVLHLVVKSDSDNFIKLSKAFREIAPTEVLVKFPGRHSSASAIFNVPEQRSCTRRFSKMADKSCWLRYPNRASLVVSHVQIIRGTDLWSSSRLVRIVRLVYGSVPVLRGFDKVNLAPTRLFGSRIFTPHSE